MKTLRLKHLKLYGLTTALVVVALALAIPFSNKLHDPEASNYLGSVPANFRIIRSSSGSLTGRGDENKFTIESNGHVSQQNTRLETSTDKQLTSAQVLEIARRVQDIDFFNLDDSYPKNGRCCDMTTVTLDITMSGDQKKVSFNRDISPDKAETDLMQLDKFLTETVGD